MSGILTKFLNYVYRCLVDTGSAHCVHGAEALAEESSGARVDESGGISHHKDIQAFL